MNHRRASARRRSARGAGRRLGARRLDRLDDRVGRRLVLTELDYALAPARPRAARAERRGDHRADDARRSSGSSARSSTVTRRPVEAMPLTGARLFADGLSSWLIRRATGDDEWAVFDRPAGSERDLVVLAESMGATLVQRHPNGRCASSAPSACCAGTG